jgi:hypothetical protein
MAEAPDDTTPERLSAAIMAELRQIREQLTGVQAAPGEAWLERLASQVDDLTALTTLQREHEREFANVRQETTRQLARLQDIDARVETGFKQVTAEVTSQVAAEVLDGLKPELQERLERLQRETHQGMADLNQHAVALRQAGKRLPWKFTSAIVVALLVALVGIWVSIGYNVWRENRHLKADIVRLRRFEALAYGLDRYLLETHYRTLSSQVREEIDKIYRGAGHIPPDAKKRRDAETARSGS